MERYIVWYQLWLKLYCRKKMYWIQLAGMVLVFIVVASVTLPDQENLSIGIFCDSGKYSEKIVDELLGKESVFTFIEYKNEEQLYEDVLDGKIECGFLLDKKLDQNIEKGDIRKSITYVGNSFSKKGETVQEIVYSVLFKLYSDELLVQNYSNIYGNEDQKQLDILIEKNHQYQSSNDLFRLEVKNIDLDVKKDTEEQTKLKTYPLKGMAGIFIFFVMFMSYGNKYENKGNNIEKVFSIRERDIYTCIKQIAAGTIPTIVSVFILIYFGNDVYVLDEMVKIILFLFISSIWISIFGSFLKDGSSFTGAIISVLLVNLLVCPVFINFEKYIPSIKYIKLLFPLGWYLY